MAYQALYRKYRPSKFSDVVAQESILKILTNSIKQNKISHAYLFSGPRGTGKTTVAKLVAKTINCLNIGDDFSVCGECENCLDIENNSSDIIEIDAASNNGVDEIRELKSKINLVPNKLKYKVYIIDEVHMLSISAFNALLKTLEEPPEHVIFILATTEFYKVPPTIVSRCQCLNFTRIATSNIESRLKEIATLENINIEDSAIHEIALYADGGMRDALGLLDKLASYSLEKITAADFFQINGLISKDDMLEFINQIQTKNNLKVIETLNKFDELGYDFSKLIERILETLRDLLVRKITVEPDLKYDPKEISELIFCFNDIYNMLKEASNRRIIVEVKLLSFMNFPNASAKSMTTLEEVNKAKVLPKPSIPEAKPPISQEISKKDKNDISTQKKVGNANEQVEPRLGYQINPEMKKIRIDNTFAMASKLLKNMVVSKWGNLVNYLSDTKYAKVAGLLQDVEIGVVSNTNIILISKYDSLLEKIYLNFNLCLDLINKILENNYVIVAITNEEFQKEVEQYKLHLKDKNYYTYQEETKPFITFQEENIENENNLCYSNLVQKAIDVFGEGYVEVE